jgi:N-acetyl-alpha-D-muramate 1-phosphate uridylyltransferase
MSAGLLPVAILAGGLATRLRPITETFPKSMLDVNGEPFIGHQLRLLQNRGARRVVLCLGYLGEIIQQHVGDGARFDLQVDYSYDGEKLLGSGGAVRKAAPLLGDAFFVMYGDSYLTCDFAAVQRTFVDSGKMGLMTVFRNQGKWDTSNIEFAGGHIRRYDKKQQTPAMQYIDYGLGMIQRRAFDMIDEREAFDLAGLYQMLLGQNQLAAHEVRERFYEIGSFAGLEETRQYIASRSEQRFNDGGVL